MIVLFCELPTAYLLDRPKHAGARARAELDAMAADEGYTAFMFERVTVDLEEYGVRIYRTYVARREA